MFFVDMPFGFNGGSRTYTINEDCGGEGGICVEQVSMHHSSNRSVVYIFGLGNHTNRFDDVFKTIPALADTVYGPANPSGGSAIPISSWTVVRSGTATKIRHIRWNIYSVNFGLAHHLENRYFHLCPPVYF